MSINDFEEMDKNGNNIEINDQRTADLTNNQANKLKRIQVSITLFYYFAGD